MQKHGHPAHAQHKQLHEAFKQDFTVLASEFDEDPSKLSPTMDAQRRVMDWPKTRIQDTDVELAAYLKEKGATRARAAAS